MLSQQEVLLSGLTVSALPPFLFQNLPELSAILIIPVRGSESRLRGFIHSFPKVTKLASPPLHLSNDPHLHNSTLESETKKIIISIDSQTKSHSCKIATERSCVPSPSFPAVVIFYVTTVTIKIQLTRI